MKQVFNTFVIVLLLVAFSYQDSTFQIRFTDGGLKQYNNNILTLKAGVFSFKFCNLHYMNAANDLFWRAESNKPCTDPQMNKLDEITRTGVQREADRVSLYKELDNMKAGAIKSLYGISLVRQ